MLPLSEFKELVKNGPLVSIDLIIYNEIGEVLLGMRKNRPAQNYWFVPGGRIFKNETIKIGFKRIFDQELPISLDYSDARFLGVYQHIYLDNFSGDDSFGTHYIVLAHEIIFNQQTPLNPGDNQHKNYQWMSISDILTTKKVHPFTKNYFRIDRRPFMNEGVVDFFQPDI